MMYVKEFFSQRLIQFLSLVIVASGLAASVSPDYIQAGIAFLSGIVLIIFVEYTVHRFVLHAFPKLAPSAYRGHVAHHQEPEDVHYLFGPVWYDALAYVFMSAMVFFITDHFFLTGSFVFGCSVFQLYYQWCHYVAHRPIIPFTAWGKWMKKRHLLHHYQDESSWYGVSNSALDRLLGTDKATLPAKKGAFPADT